jgi:hypothetical protein
MGDPRRSSGQGAKFLSPAAHVFWFTLVFERFILSDQ